jgi:hypothetical protein
MEGHEARKSTHATCLGRLDESRSTRREKTSPDHMTINILQLAVLFICELVFLCHGLHAYDISASIFILVYILGWRIIGVGHV